MAKKKRTKNKPAGKARAKKQAAVDIRAHKLNVMEVQLEKIRPWEENPRHTQEAVAAVVKSIEAFGFTNPLLVSRRNGYIIAGHTRYEALKKLGAKTAPVIYLDLDETDRKVYAVFDNKSVELAGWDNLKLADLFCEFNQLDVDLDLSGFSKLEIDDIVTGPTGMEPNPKDDQVPAVPKKAITKPGDLWLLGECAVCPKCGKICEL